MKENAMTQEWKVLGLAALGTLATQASPALAETQPNTHEIHIHAGEVFGDDFEETSVSGRTPELDDEVAFGVRYGYNFTDHWGFELSLGHSPGSVTELAGEDVDLDLTTLDVDAVWHFGSLSRWSPYVVAGAGYAWADLDNQFVATVDGQDAAVDDDNSYTLNAGIGAKYFATDRVLIHLEARYRYLDSVIDASDDSLDTFETTIGVGWQF
jgi:outer membrane beta-barrel protein